MLLSASAFTLGTSVWIAQATQRAVQASRLSDDYTRAWKAVAAEESLERKYRLEPEPAVRAAFDRADADLVVAMHRVEADGLASDRATARTVLSEHGPYLAAVRSMFNAVDRGDRPGVLRLDGTSVDPAFDRIQQLVAAEEADHHAASLADLTRLRSLSRFVSRATPLVFAAGVVLVMLFGLVLRRTRRQLDRHREQAVHDSLHDALTGLPNRILLTGRLAQALDAAARQGQRTGLLLIDLDRFKEVNDSLGHHCGDALLVQIGPRLSRALPDDVLIARLGGDEFAVLLPSVAGGPAALRVARRVADALAEPFTVEGVDLELEASIGVVVSGEHGDDASTLLRHADVAMYVAKERRVGVFEYDRQADRHSRERLALVSRLRRALDRSELVVHYQPKVHVRTGTVCGAEALVRWLHPDRGLLPPAEFIPVAEHTALVGPLTRYILDAALAQVREWWDLGYRIPVAVNLAARNLLDENLAGEVAELLARHGLPPQLLELEVTESAIITEPRRARRLLARLHELGVRIAVDDFGAGYTSLAQLKDLPVSELKVDRSFVLGMASDPSDAMIVQSVVDLGHNLGLTSVAEGVESAAAMATLLRYGCDIAQGYHLSPPLPPEQFLTWCSRRSAPTDGSPPPAGSLQAPIGIARVPTPGRVLR